MNFFKSEDVKVFPCAYRGTDSQGNYFNPESIIQSEFNFVNSPNRHWKGSYVISYTNNILKVVINGYYFEISNISPDSDYLKSISDLYLGIQVANAAINGTSNQTEVLANLNKIVDNKGQVANESLDENLNGVYYFTGLAYDKSPLTGCITLAALKKNDNWEIVPSSLLPEITHGDTKGSSILPGDVKIDGNINITSNTTISGTTDINNKLTVKNNGAEINGSTNINGNTAIIGDSVNINNIGQGTTTIGAPNSTTIIKGNLDIPNAIDVTYKNGILTIKRGLKTLQTQTNLA